MKPSLMQLNIINAIAFQIVWFICVTTTDATSIVAVVLLLLGHAFFIVRDNREWLLIIGFTLVGVVIDSLLQSFGFIWFSKAIFYSESILVIPIWMMCLWLAFSTTLMHGLFWLHGRLKLAFLVGLCVVPVSYYAGLTLSESASIEPVWLLLLTIGIVWSVLLPVTFFIAEKCNLRPLNDYCAC